MGEESRAASVVGLLTGQPSIEGDIPMMSLTRSSPIPVYKESVMLYNIPIEIWKDVSKFKGLYQVSSLGRVKRLGNTPRCKKDRILKPYRDIRNNRYFAVKLSKNGRKFQREVHVLVAREFIGERLKGHQVNHKDSNKENNSVNNLEYVKPVDNIRHSILSGTFVKRKLLKEDVINIRTSSKTPKELASIYGCSIVNIRNILRRKCFKWV